MQRSATAGSDVIVGTNGPDVIFGLGGDDIICGFDGDDIIYGDTADPSSEVGENDTINGGMGNDTIYGGPWQDFLFGSAGNDTIHGDLPGSSIGFADNIEGGNGNDRITGGPGNDLIWGDRQDGGYGHDTIDMVTDDPTDHDEAWAGRGNDTIYAEDGKGQNVWGQSGAATPATSTRRSMCGRRARWSCSSFDLRASGELGDLEQVAVGVAEERTRLAVTHVRWRQELGASARQELVQPEAIVRRGRSTVPTGRSRSGRRGASVTVGLPSSGSPPVTSRNPVAEEFQHHRGAAVLAKQLRVEHLEVPVATALDIGDDQHVSERPTPRIVPPRPSVRVVTSR